MFVKESHQNWHYRFKDEYSPDHPSLPPLSWRCCVQWTFFSSSSSLWGWTGSSTGHGWWDTNKTTKQNSYSVCIIHVHYALPILYTLFLNRVLKFKAVGDNIVLTFIFCNNTCVWTAGGVCPTVDPDVLPVPCCPLLHHLVRPLPSLHWHHRWATANSHHHGNQLDDHCRAPPHLWGECRLLI